MLHGATVGGWEFDLVAERLGSKDVASVSPDLFGHGRSDRPRGRYDLERFARQIEELIKNLGLDDVYLVGHSLGAAVAVQIALRGRVGLKGLVLAAPLYDFESLHPMSRLLGWPVVGPALVGTVVLPGLRRRRRRRYAPIEGGVFLERFREQLAKPGFAGALHRLFRDGALDNQASLYRALEATDVPRHLLRGERDNVCPPEHVDVVQALADAPIREIEQAGHTMLLTHPDPVARAIETFIREVGG